MATNIINDGVAVSGDGLPVYYNSSYSSAAIRKLTFQVYGPGGLAGYNPAGTALIEYYNPFTGHTTVKTQYIGGGFGPSQISITTGSLFEGHSHGMVKITFIDALNIPGLPDGMEYIGSLKKLLNIYGYIEQGVNGIFSVAGYSASLLSEETKEIEFNNSYPAGYLGGLGIYGYNLPTWLSPIYDFQGNLIGLDYQQCFGPEVPIDMWPIDPSLRPGPDGAYDQSEVSAKVWKKPIGQILVGDIVVSFDEHDNLVPGLVTHTMNNDVRILLDFHGTRVTPGHVYYSPESQKSHKFETLIDLLRDDSVIKHQDGTLIRAATNVPVGSPRDRFVKAVTRTSKRDGAFVQNDTGRIRLGTRVLIGTGEERRSLSVADLIEAGGATVGEDELIRVGDGPAMPFLWEFGDTLPNPEDFILACSGTTLEDIYKAAEWEGQVPRLPAPTVLDRGPVHPLEGAALSAIPRNQPLDVTHPQMASAGPKRFMNRRPRKATMPNQHRVTGRSLPASGGSD